MNMENQSNIIVHDYMGHCIYQKCDDGFVNLSRMAKLFGKQVSDWTRLTCTKAYIEEVSAVTGFPRDMLLVVKQGGNHKEPQGTWAHKLIAIRFAQWLDEALAVWCNQHLLELMETGITKLEPEVLAIQKESEDFWYYLEKLIELKPMLQKDVELAKQMFKRLYETY